jgi:hypothetical protein
VIKTNAAAAFPVGAILGPTDEGDGGSWDEYTRQIPQLLRWTVTDNSGAICAFYSWQMPEEWWNDDPQTEGYTPDYAVRSRQTTPYSAQFTSWVSDYDGAFGSGGDTHEGWVMRAVDCAGNAATVKIQSSDELTVLQDDNYYPNRDTLNPGQISYAGTWRVTSCACASGGTMRNATAGGASFTFTRTYERDDHVALVMAKGPGRGRADVYVDGTKVTTINSNASANANRVIVWDKWMAAGTHTVRVVNLATAGHARIDIDAVLTN